MVRQLPAPSALRTTSSLRREALRISSRLATLAIAIANTSVTAAQSPSITGRTVVAARPSSGSRRTAQLCKRRSSAAIPCIVAFKSSEASARLTPSRRRPTIQ